MAFFLSAIVTGNEDFLDLVKKGDAAAVGAALAGSPNLVHGRPSGGPSAILLAIYHSHPEIVDVFREHGAELDFYEACAAGDRARAEALLAGDPSLLDSFAPDGFTPLTLAIFFGHQELALLLLERGGDVNRAARNSAAVAPLHSAAARRDARMLEALLQRGADPNAMQAGGFTPLHSCAMNNDDVGVLLLLRHGASKARASLGGRLPRDLALENNNAALAELLAP